MANNDETVAEITNIMRGRVYPISLCPDLAMRGYADRIEVAHKREIIEAVKPIEANYEYALKQLAAKGTEIAKLRVCLKEAVEWSCGNTDEACEDCVAHGGDTPCKCEKWRKVLEGGQDG